MKNYIYMISIFMLSVLVAGCSSETNASLNTENITFEKKSTNSNKEKLAVVTEGKEKKDTVSLKENSLFQFEAVDGNYKYNVFLFAEDEQKVLYNAEDNAAAKKGDSYFAGNYSVYLAEKDSTVAYKQAALDDIGEAAFDPAVKQAYPLILGSKTLIAITQQEDKEHSKVHLLAIKDGEIKKVQSEKELVTISGKEMKAINQKYLQTAHTDSKLNSMVFSTWAFDETVPSISLHDQSIISNGMNEENVSLGEYWLNLWSEKEGHFFPYLNLELSKDVLEKAKQGIPIGSPYPIGTNIDEIKKTDPHYMEEGFGEDGTPYVMYPEITYYFEQVTGNVTAVSIPGQRMKMTLEEVKRVFGKPVHEGKDEHGRTLAIYAADKYKIEVAADEDGKVSRAYLKKI